MGHNTLVVYNDVVKRFILLPDGEGIPASGIALSEQAGNSLSKKSDGLYGASVDHMSWDPVLSQLVIHLTDGTSHAVSLPTAASPPVRDEFDPIQPGEQILTLSGAAKGTGHVLSINGLIQPLDSYSVLGNQLTLPPALMIEIGDRISFQYFQL